MFPNNKRKSQIERGFALAAVNSSVIQLKLFSSQKAPSDVVRERRDQFNDSAKSNFYKWIAKNRPKILFQLGFNQKHIDEIAENGTKSRFKRHNKLSREYNIDHILSLHLGGTNSFDNLCLISRDWNSAKAEMEEAQLILYPDLEEIQTIVPVERDGKYIKFVPTPSHAKHLKAV